MSEHPASDATTMNVGGVSTAAMAENVAAVQQAASQAAMGMLDATMDSAAQMMMQLLEALPTPGVGGSVDTYA